MDKEKPSVSSADNSVYAGNIIAYGLLLFVIVVFIIAIPMSWRNLFRDFDEFPLECTFWVITAIISLIVAYIMGFKAGIGTAAVVGPIFEMIIQKEIGLVYFTLFPLMFAAFAVIPSGIGFVIRKIRHKNKRG